MLEIYKEGIECDRELEFTIGVLLDITKKYENLEEALSKLNTREGAVKALTAMYNGATEKLWRRYGISDKPISVGYTYKHLWDDNRLISFVVNAYLESAPKSKDINTRQGKTAMEDIILSGLTIGLEYNDIMQLTLREFTALATAWKDRNNTVSIKPGEKIEGIGSFEDLMR